MKKTVAIIICISLVLSAMVGFAAGISVYVNGVKVEFDAEPEIVNGRTMVPLRAISEALGVEPVWNAETSSIILNYNGVQTTITIGSETVMRYEEGQAETSQIDAPPYIKDGRTMVPLRFIAEALNKTVEWEGSTSTVKINDKKPPLIIPQETQTETTIGLNTPEEEIVFVFQWSALEALTELSSEDAFSAAIMQAPETTFPTMVGTSWLDSVVTVTISNLMKTNPTRANQLVSLLKSKDYDSYYEQTMAEAKKMGYYITCPFDKLDIYGYDAAYVLVIGSEKGWNFTTNPLLYNYTILSADGKELRYYTVNKEFGFITICEEINSSNGNTLTRIVKMFRETENVTTDDLADAVYEDMSGKHVINRQPQSSSL